MALFGKKDNSREEGQGGPLSKRGSAALAKAGAPLTIGGLEEKLLKMFPASQAEEWDRTGLLVGERGLAVTGVAVALDPTVEAIRPVLARAFGGPQPGGGGVGGGPQPRGPHEPPHRP